MKPISNNDPRIGKVSRLCCKTKNGLSAGAVMQKMGMSRTLTQHLLAHCRKQELVILYKVPNGEWQYMSHADWRELMDDPSAQPRLRRRDQGKRMYHWRRGTGERDSRNQITDPPEWPIVRSYVKAGEVPPPMTQAVNSVFALGAA